MYLGNIPATSFEAVKKDRFTGLTGTGVTLSHSVTNVQDIVVWVNSVKQDYNNYSVNGTALTLGGSLVSADVVQVLYVGRTFQTVNPPADSVGPSQTAPTIITGQTAETSIATDDTILIHDTSASALRKMTRANFVSGIGGTNTPAFHARVDSANSTTDTTETKVTFGTEVFDVGGCYDTSTSRFTVPSGEAGKYFIYSRIRVDSATDSEIYDLLIKKNGSTVFQHSANQYRYTSAYVSGILDLSASDYLEVYVLIQNNLSLRNDQRECFFGGYKIIE